MSLAVKLAVPLAAFALGTVIALALGARGLGPAATFGILAFAVAMVAVLVADSPPEGDRG